MSDVKHNNLRYMSIVVSFKIIDLFICHGRLLAGVCTAKYTRANAQRSDKEIWSTYPNTSLIKLRQSFFSLKVKKDYICYSHNHDNMMKKLLAYIPIISKYRLLI